MNGGRARARIGLHMRGLSCRACAPARAAEAFITDQTGDEVSVLDLGSKQIVARIPVSGKPAGIAMARDGKHRLCHESRKANMFR